MPSLAVLGLGWSVPGRILDNAALERLVETSDTWIRERTGIAERRTVKGLGLAASDLALAAARRALASAALAPHSIDRVIVATCTGDHPMPATACLLQAALGIPGGAAFDLNAACSGFLYGLDQAAAALAAGHAGRVLLVAAEAMTAYVDWQDRSTCVLFGDGAGAAVLGAGSDLLAITLGADGRRAGDLVIPAGGSRLPLSATVLEQRLHTIHMRGREVFRAAIEAMSRALCDAAALARVSLGELRWVFAHQANARILRGVAASVRLPEATFWSNIERLGNTGAASIPISLAEAWEAGALAPGDLIGLVAAGAGLTWGAAIMRWGLEAPEKKSCAR